MTSRDYEAEKKRMIQGFHTWNTYSVTSHVKMPEAFSINLAFKEFLRCGYLNQPLIGRRGRGVEEVFAGTHTYGDDYTSLEIEWKRIRYRVQSAHDPDGNLVMKVEELSNTTRFPSLCVIEGGILWNYPGTCIRDGNELKWENPSGSEMTLHLSSAHVQEDPYVLYSGAYLPILLDEPLYFTMNCIYTPEQIEAIFAKRIGEYQARKASFGEFGDLWEGMQSGLGWNEVYDPQHNRLLSNVSRIWNSQRGGFGMFCWDNLFAACMQSLDDCARARGNAIEILNEKTDEGFVPNCSNGNGRKTFDRSQPPVGSMMIREIYRRDPQKWFLELTFPTLVEWNNWWIKKRLNGELLSWGSNWYDNKWEMPGIHDTEGGALESGLDNSPMYDDCEVTFNKEKSIQNLQDVGLNGLYIADCDALADIAGILGYEDEKKRLTERAESMRRSIQKLWDDKTGFFYNFRTDTNEFSWCKSPTNFYPLMGKCASPEQFDRMVSDHLLNPKEFFSRFMIPSISRDHPAYADNNYWRGRIWGPMNFLVYLGLLNYPDCEARHILAKKSSDLFLQEWLKHRYIFENYNAETGVGDDVISSDKFYHWGGLLAFVALIDNNFLPGFCQKLS